MFKFKKGGTKLTDNIMTLIDYLCKIGLQEDLDFCREAAQFFGQRIIDLEPEEVIGVKKHERSEIRTNHRKGTRDRASETRVGELNS
jgi:transposase-like protein